MEGLQHEAKALVAIAIKQSIENGLGDTLKSKIAGLREIKIALFDHQDATTGLETNNLLENHAKISLLPQRPSGPQYGHQATAREVLDGSQMLYTSSRLDDSTWTDLTIPLHCTNAPKEVSSCFGSLIVTLDCADVDFIDSRSVEASLALAQALCTHHSQQLREFVSLVTSLLLSPPPILMDYKATIGSTPTTQELDRDVAPPCRFSSQIAPLCTALQFPGPPPLVNLLTLRFQESWLEQEYHEWKAESLNTLDAYSLLACFVMLAAGLNGLLCWAALLVITATAAALATLPRCAAFYRNHRDKVLCGVTMCGVALMQFGGRYESAVDNQLLLILSLFLPSRLTWHALQLLAVFAWRAGCMVTLHWWGSASTPRHQVHYLCAAQKLMQLVVGAFLAPLLLVYIMEVVSRRVFLARQAIMAAEEEEEEEEEDWLWQEWCRHE